MKTFLSVAWVLLIGVTLFLFLACGDDDDDDLYYSDEDAEDVPPLPGDDDTADDDATDDDTGDDDDTSGLPDGTPCTENEQCESTFCVDGVCCNTACEGTCQGCSLTDSTGICTTRPAEDNFECDPCYACDGSAMIARP